MFAPDNYPAPTFTLIHESGIVLCNTCGSVVANGDQHIAWHALLAPHVYDTSFKEAVPALDSNAV